jgi:hypothetical protein
VWLPAGRVFLAPLIGVVNAPSEPDLVVTDAQSRKALNAAACLGRASTQQCRSISHLRLTNLVIGAERVKST